jgi:hypothetical protein
MVELIAKGNLFTSFSDDQKRVLYEQIAKDLAEAAQQQIILRFDNSVQLASMVGQRADQEALRAIYRSLKVNIKSIDPLKLEAIFDDDYSHWYGGEELPEEVATILQDIIESSLRDWFNTPEPSEIILKTLVAA